VKDREYNLSSGTFILPPKADHEGILSEFNAVVQGQATQVRGCPMTDSDANLVLTLYQGLDPAMRDSLMARTIPEMLTVTIRCHSLSTHDISWTMFQHKKVG
jgi:hypothetical protein